MLWYVCVDRAHCNMMVPAVKSLDFAMSSSLEPLKRFICIITTQIYKHLQLSQQKVLDLCKISLNLKIKQ